MEAEDARILATAHFLAEPLPAAGLPAAMPPPLEVQATAVHDNLPADAVVVPNVPEAGSSSTHAALIPVDGAGTALVAADDADASRKRRRGGDGSGDSHQENQERMYDLLRAFAARTGHANAPRGHIEAGEKLGIWLMHQRTRESTEHAHQKAMARAECCACEGRLRKRRIIDCRCRSGSSAPARRPMPSSTRLPPPRPVGRTKEEPKVPPKAASAFARCCTALDASNRESVTGRMEHGECGC